MTALLALRDLEVGHRGGVLLRLPALELDAGACTALVGESGSGKSLTVQALLGLLPHGLDARGTLQLDGREVALGGAAHRALAGHGLAWVPQDPLASLHPLRTVGAQLVETLRAVRGLDRRAAAGEATALLARVQVPDPTAALQRRAHEFSGGQRQRIAIALALATRPRVLVADEPTSALDARIARDVLRLLDTLRAQDGLAVLLVSHDLPRVAAHAQRVLVLRRGEVVEAGATADVLERPVHPYTRALVEADRLGELGTVEDVGDARDVPAAIDARDAGEATTGTIAIPSSRRALPVAGDGADVAPDARPLVPTSAPSRFQSSAVAAVRCVEDIADADADADADAHADAIVLDARGLRLRYPRAASEALSGVDLVLRRGEALAIVGESGSGKSSLGRVLLRLVRRAEGEVRLRHDGREVDLLRLSTRELRPLRRALGVVFQDPHASLDPRMRVLDLVTEPLRIHGIGDAAERRARAAALLRDVGLEPAMLDRHPHQFSGGQRQRIAIARALAAEPAVLLCDEAVSALDAQHRREVLVLLDGLRRRRGLALLFITHDLAAAAALASRIAVMDGGRIVETGPTRAVLAAPRNPHVRALVDATRP